MFFYNLAKLNTNYVTCKNCYSENTHNVLCKNCYSENTNLCNCNNNLYKNGKINNLLGGSSRLCPSCNGNSNGNSNSNGNDVKYQRIGFNDNIKKEEDILLKYGYSLNDTHENRINALNKAITKNPKLKILRHINALRTLQKSNKKIYNKLNKDIEWIQRLNQETNN